MEFEKYGPLAESKELASNEKTNWIPKVILLGLGVIIGIAWINLVRDNQQWNKINKGGNGV